MSELGGDQVFTASARPEAEAKKGLVARLKEKWKTAVEKETVERQAYAQKKAEWKKIGPQLEQTQIEAFNKIIGALDEGKVKQIAEKMRGIVKVNAKITRATTATVDMVVGTIPLIAGADLRGRGIVALFNDITGRRPTRARTVIGAIAGGGAGVALGAGVLWLAPTRRAATWVAEKTGNVGERVVKWTNKIIKKKEMSAPVSV